MMVPDARPKARIRYIKRFLVRRTIWEIGLSDIVIYEDENIKLDEPSQILQLIRQSIKNSELNSQEAKGIGIIGTAGSCFGTARDTHHCNPASF